MSRCFVCRLSPVRRESLFCVQAFPLCAVSRCFVFRLSPVRGESSWVESPAPRRRGRQAHSGAHVEAQLGVVSVVSCLRERHRRWIPVPESKLMSVTSLRQRVVSISTKQSSVPRATYFNSKTVECIA